MKRSVGLKAAIFLVLLTQFTETNAKDFGVQGNVFEIKEEDMLSVIGNRLSSMQRSGILAAKQLEMQKRAERFIARPTPVERVVHTVERRVREFDPTYIVSRDIRDHEGRLIHAAGASINPLDTVGLPEKLLFIDGDNEKQVAWALNLQRTGKHSLKMILVNGSPMELMNKHHTRFYFDQKGIMTLKLGITQVPAVVTQNGAKLRIEEVVLGG